MGILRRNLVSITLSFLLMAGTSGCMYLIVGTAGVVGGYVVSPDTVEGITNYSVGETWDSAHQILSIMGAIQQENEAFGQITAIVNGCRVTVTIMAVNAASCKLNIKARKSFMPKIEVAQDIYMKIIRGMEE